MAPALRCALRTPSPSPGCLPRPSFLLPVVTAAGLLSPGSCSLGVQVCHQLLPHVFALCLKAAPQEPGSEEVQAAARSLAAGDAAPFCSPGLWERLRIEVVEPLVASLESEDAAAEGDVARQAQLAVDTAEALATRPCAHPCCTTILGAREAAALRGKRCSGCRAVRYCGPACQKADWRAHKAACREVARRRGGAGSA